MWISDLASHDGNISLTLRHRSIVIS